METGLQVATSTSTGGVWITTTGSMITTSINFVSQSFSNATISRITATSSTAPLPVTLVSFNAQKNEQQHSVLLNWEVANEMNMDRYNVERSPDGKDFTNIGDVAANNEPRYSLTDNHPANGTNYYRLQMMERDGSFKYSPVRQVFFGTKESDIKVWPNPIVTTVNIHSSDASMTDMEGVIVNLAGSLVMKFNLSSAGTTTLDGSMWPTGIYFLRLANGNIFKIEKQ